MPHARLTGKQYNKRTNKQTTALVIGVYHNTQHALPRLPASKSEAHSNHNRNTRSALPRAHTPRAALIDGPPRDDVADHARLDEVREQVQRRDLGHHLHTHAAAVTRHIEDRALRATATQSLIQIQIQAARTVGAFNKPRSRALEARRYAYNCLQRSL